MKHRLNVYISIWQARWKIEPERCYNPKGIFAWFVIALVNPDWFEKGDAK